VNPLYREAAHMATGGWIMGAVTVLFLACFVGCTWWAYASRNRALLEEAARLPLTTGEDDS
jgi:cbb3-type cytochrome oxidase subunit 3